MEKQPSYGRILLIRLDNMGDVIMSNAAFTALKKQYPHSQLTLLTSSMAAPIAPFLGSIDDVMVYDIPWIRINDPSPSADIHALVQILKARKYDACIIFNVYSQSSFPAALLAYLAGIPVRVAYARENPYGLLTHWVPDPEPFEKIRHQIHRDMALLEVIGITREMCIRPSLDTVDRHALPDSDILQEIGDTHDYIIVNMDVSEAKRRFDPEIIRQIVWQLLQQGEKIIFTGAAHSPYLDICCTGIASPLFIHAVGRTSIPELLSIIQYAKAVITLNTGIAHMACAYDRPTLVLYANTNPQHIPWSNHSDFIPYDIPEALKSQNQIIRYVDRMTNEEKVHPLPTATEVLTRLKMLIGSVEYSESYHLN